MYYRECFSDISPGAFNQPPWIEPNRKLNFVVIVLFCWLAGLNWNIEIKLFYVSIALITSLDFRKTQLFFLSIILVSFTGIIKLPYILQDSIHVHILL